MSPTNRWTHAFLDAMRWEGDPLADAVIARVVTEGGPGALHGLLKLVLEEPGGPRPPPLLPSLLKKWDALLSRSAPRKKVA